MARGQQKIQSQQKNQKKADAARKAGIDQKAAAAKVISFQSECFLQIHLKRFSGTQSQMYRLSCHDARSKNLQATLREQVSELKCS